MGKKNSVNVIGGDPEIVKEKIMAMPADALGELERVLKENTNEIISDGQTERLDFVMTCIQQRKIQLGRMMASAFLNSRMANDSTFLFYHGIIAMYSMMEDSFMLIKDNIWQSVGKPLKIYEDRYKTFMENVKYSQKECTRYLLHGFMNEYMDEYEDNFFSTKLSVEVHKMAKETMDNMYKNIRKEANKVVKRWEKEDEKNGVKREYKKFNSGYISALLIIHQMCEDLYKDTSVHKEKIIELRKSFEGNPFLYDVEVFKKMSTATYLLAEDLIGGKTLMDRSGLIGYSHTEVHVVNEKMQDDGEKLRARGFGLIAETQYDYLCYYHCKVAFETAVNGSVRDGAKHEVVTMLMKGGEKNPRTAWMSYMKDIRQLIRQTEAEPENTEDYFYELRDTMNMMSNNEKFTLKSFVKLNRSCVRQLARVEAWKDDDVVALEREALMEIVEKQKKPTPKGGRRKNDGRKEESTKEPSLCAAV